MDLFKAYDWIPHESLMAKWQCYDIDLKKSALLVDYFTNRK